MNNPAVVHSAIYEGRVEHVRCTPREHRFGMNLGLLYLDLDELDAVARLTPLFKSERWAPLSFHRQDYLPSTGSLADAARDVVAQRKGFRPTGPVRMLTNPRYFGYGFNPVSFYYCHDEQGSLAAVIAEITNTPWQQRYCYVLDARTSGDRVQAEFAKAFHVSPFMPMAQRYAWMFTLAGPTLAVRMANIVDSRIVFTAGITAVRQPLTAAALHRLLIRHPAQTAQVISRIYWEALRLWLKKIPFYSNPTNVSPQIA